MCVESGERQIMYLREREREREREKERVRNFVICASE
jgi:hypothetical protein